MQYLPTYNVVEAMETFYNIKVPIDETGSLTHKFLSHNHCDQGEGAGYGNLISLRKMSTQYLPLLESKQGSKQRWQGSRTGLHTAIMEMKKSF